MTPSLDQSRTEPAEHSDLAFCYRTQMLSYEHTVLGELYWLSVNIRISFRVFPFLWKDTSGLGLINRSIPPHPTLFHILEVVGRLQLLQNIWTISQSCHWLPRVVLHFRGKHYGIIDKAEGKHSREWGSIPSSATDLLGDLSQFSFSPNASVSS